jgi:anti-sigma factor RsiW
MSASTCRSPLDDGELLGYWLGELDAAREIEIDEHLFACRACGEALGRLVALGDAVRTLIAHGGATGIMPPEFVARLKAAGLRVHEYWLKPQGSVACTIAPQDDLVVAHVEVPLDGVQRLDVVIHEVEAEQTFRLTDVGFNPASGEVVLVPKASDLRSRGRSTQRVELVAVSGAGEQVLGEYVFNHSPYRR